MAVFPLKMQLMFAFGTAWDSFIIRPGERRILDGEFPLYEASSDAEDQRAWRCQILIADHQVYIHVVEVMSSKLLSHFAGSITVLSSIMKGD
jgi:hypothetical protein